MPSECIANPLQRELADAIIRLQSLDEIRILLACGAKANEPVTQGLRPLHYAVWQRYTEAAQLLLVRGADIDATDECGYSALHLAAEHGYLDLVKVLLEHGAKVDHRPETGELFPRYDDPFLSSSFLCHLLIIHPPLFSANYSDLFIDVYSPYALITMHLSISIDKRQPRLYG